MSGELTRADNIFSATSATDIHEILMSCDKHEFIDDNFLMKDTTFNSLKDVPRSLIDSVKPLPRIECPFLENFLSLIKHENPVILTNVINLWLALTSRKWSVNNIKSVCGRHDSAVYIIISSHNSYIHLNYNIFYSDLHTKLPSIIQSTSLLNSLIATSCRICKLNIILEALK